MSQAEVAKYLQISTDSYGLKERGEYQFKVSEAFLLSKLFNRPIDYIFLPNDFENFEVKEGHHA